jgi:histidine triad (HIT) family protein
MSLALKEVRKCDGVWIEQNNEPASGQHAFHYHMHIVPRFKDDNLRINLAQDKVYVSTQEERLSYAEDLKNYLTN